MQIHELGDGADSKETLFSVRAKDGGSIKSAIAEAQVCFFVLSGNPFDVGWSSSCPQEAEGEGLALGVLFVAL
jgi:hypothetical protein